MTKNEEVSVVIRCLQCNRVFTVPVDASADEVLDKLSKNGCIYCEKAGKHAQLEVLSIEKGVNDPFLNQEWLNLTKYVPFE